MPKRCHEDLLHQVLNHVQIGHQVSNNPKQLSLMATNQFTKGSRVAILTSSNQVVVVTQIHLHSKFCYFEIRYSLFVTRY